MYIYIYIYIYIYNSWLSKWWVATPAIVRLGLALSRASCLAPMFAPWFIGGDALRLGIGVEPTILMVIFMDFWWFSLMVDFGNPQKEEDK